MSLKNKEEKSIKRQILIVFLKTIISAGLLYIVFRKAGIGNVIGLLRDINPLHMVIAIVMYMFSLYISTLRWKILLAKGFSTWRLFSFYIIGSFFNTFLPGLIGGDAVKAYYLYKHNGQMGQSLASVFMDRYIGFASLITLGLLAFPFGFKYFRGSWLEWALPFIVLLFIAGSFIFFGLRLGTRFSAIKEMHEYFDYYRTKKGILLRVFLYSIFLQLFVMASIYVLAMGLGLRVSPIWFIMFIPIITTVAMLPISVSGLGTREAAFVALFGLVGLRAEEATALSFAWFLSIAIGGLPGLVFYIKRRAGD